ILLALDRLVEDLRPRVFQGSSAAIATCLKPSLFTQQLLVVGEPPDVKIAFYNRPADCAAGLAVMRAVGEAAVGSELDDVGERDADALLGIPQCEATQTWRVDRHCAGWQDHEFARGRGVPAFPIVANCSCLQRKCACAQSICERR